MLPSPLSGSLTCEEVKRKWEGSEERNKELMIIFIKLTSISKHISAKNEFSLSAAICCRCINYYLQKIIETKNAGFGIREPKFRYLSLNI